MKSRYVYRDGKVIYAEENGKVTVNELPESNDAGFYVMGDIEPYQSMCDGSMVMGRRQHREHLKAHGVVEVGDQVHHLKPYGQYRSPEGLKDTLIREVHRAKDAQRSGRKYGSH